MWTIGYGHTGPEVKPGLTITQAQADAYLIQDLNKAADVVRANAMPCTQGQFDALTDFTFNLGGKRLRGSTLLRLHRSGNCGAAAEEFKKWKYAGKKVLPGLVKRREAERKLYLGLS